MDHPLQNTPRNLLSSDKKQLSNLDELSQKRPISHMGRLGNKPFVYNERSVLPNIKKDQTLVLVYKKKSYQTDI